MQNWYVRPIAKDVEICPVLFTAPVSNRFLLLCYTFIGSRSRHKWNIAAVSGLELLSPYCIEKIQKHRRYPNSLSMVNVPVSYIP